MLQTFGNKLQTFQKQITITVCRGTGYDILRTYYKLIKTSYKLLKTYYELLKTNYKLTKTDYEINEKRVTNF